ncbi:sulfite exporter TauE/SafE family protein [Corynebacterium glyciniphilum]|uniref:sulfite exporter TauE/SafE family protein n=1 Tax=Corynebacterium glyciniphilum TaxID=1404244 RepID=UPI003DA068B7
MELANLSGSELLPLIVATVIAGMLDAAVGSGGAVLLPALLVVAPGGTAAAVPLAVNKGVAVAGNLVAAVQYGRPGSVRIGAKVLVPALSSAVAGVLVGVWFAAVMDVALLTWLAAISLAVLAVCLAARLFPGVGTSAPQRPRPGLVPLAVGTIGLYDGMIGPATGSLLQLTLQRLLARPVHEILALVRLVQAWLNANAAVVLWIVVGPDPAMIVVLAIAHGLGGAIGARVAGHVSANVLHVVLVVCIAASVVRMVLAV